MYKNKWPIWSSIKKLCFTVLYRRTENLPKKYHSNEILPQPSRNWAFKATFLEFCQPFTYRVNFKTMSGEFSMINRLQRPRFIHGYTCLFMAIHGNTWVTSPACKQGLNCANFRSPKWPLNDNFSRQGEKVSHNSDCIGRNFESLSHHKTA